ncbi:DNA cytosine methyltransferase [Mucilaginibacter endophyticus]|uniref:DNA cytosine methyltransferase n=1 Tax=Mucilaginibacter endophyticus TaxID=2675003 RepID=UPI000E0CF1A1|nr:DNA cytosine methyltransferase [Mucilaginibacter endophyticus]
MKLKLLDLYCCQGVGGYGFELAGFDVTGVDLFPQPKHPGEFIQADAIEYVLAHGHEYDYIHASPPCQDASMASMQFRVAGKEYPKLIEATRAALIEVDKPYDIENVPGAALINPILLCGSMFGIPTYRHRLFESNWDLQQPLHLKHVAKNAKMGRAIKDGEFIQYVGHFSGVKHVQEFTGAHWADQYGLAQSIPPQYTKYIGEQFLKTLTP